MQVNSFLSSKLPVTRIDDGAARFMLSMLKTVQKFWGEYLQFKADITGGKASGQWGMIFYSSRESLRMGIDAYLASKGYCALHTPLDRLRLLAFDVGIDSALYSDAHELEYANPDTAEDVRKYADRCTAFIEESLGMNWVTRELERATGGLRWNADSYGFHKLLEEEYGVQMNQSTKAIQLKRECLKKLAPSLYKELEEKIWHSVKE